MEQVEIFYGIAKSIAGRFYLEGMAFEDKVQECVIHAWRHVETYDPRMYFYVRKLMFNRLKDLLRKQTRRKGVVEYDFQEEFHVTSPDEVIVSIPFSDEEQKRIVTVMLDCDFSLVKASECLGLRYYQLSNKWKKAKWDLRRNSQNINYLQTEICWLTAQNS